MDESKPRKLTKPEIAGALVFGTVWGVLVAFVIALANRHQFGHWESRDRILGRIVVYIVTGALGTLIYKKTRPDYFAVQPRSPKQTRIWIAVFIALMLGLAYVLWRII